MPLSLVTSAGKVVTRRFLLSFYGLAKFKGLYYYMRVLVLKLFIPRLSLLVMAETGRNCAVSAFCFLGRGRYRVWCEWL